MNEELIELSNIEIYEHCILNTKTGEKTYNKEKKQMPFFTGVYYKNEDVFFAIYPTIDGPMMYYEGKKYPLKQDLTITLAINENIREFRIKEYDIYIKYNISPYIGFDVWSDEMDVDLFFQIEKSYKNEDYYAKYTTHICSLH